VETETKTCLICGEIYGRPLDRCAEAWGKSKYCSNACSGKARRGDVRSEAFKENQRKMATGRHHDPYTCARLREMARNRSKGRMSSQRKICPECGGPKPAYSAKMCVACYRRINAAPPSSLKIRNSREYRIWREAVFERDQYSCVFCGVRGGPLNADHIKPFAYFPELRFSLSNGRTLCVPCHKTTDTYSWKAKLHKPTSIAN